MIEEHPLERIPVHDAREVADVLFKNSEPRKETLERVEVPDLPRVEPPTITPLERFWAWLNYFVQGEIVRGTRGEPVANPITLASFAVNWWKWLLGGIVVVVLVLAIGKLL